MIIYNERNSIIYLLSPTIQTISAIPINPNGKYNLSSIDITTRIIIAGNNFKKLLDMDLPTDPNLQVFEDKIIFDEDVVFYIKTNRNLQVLLIILFLLAVAYILWKY